MVAERFCYLLFLGGGCYDVWSKEATDIKCFTNFVLLSPRTYVDGLFISLHDAFGMEYVAFTLVWANTKVQQAFLAVFEVLDVCGVDCSYQVFECFVSCFRAGET